VPDSDEFRFDIGEDRHLRTTVTDGLIQSRALISWNVRLRGEPVRWRRQDPVQEHGLAGPTRCGSLPDGVMLLSVPEGFGREGQSPSGISFRLSGNQFTTNAFVIFTCPGSVGVYRWQLEGSRLNFTPLREDRDVWRVGLVKGSPATSSSQVAEKRPQIEGV
jgi:hypothetical protein